MHPPPGDVGSAVIDDDDLSRRNGLRQSAFDCFSEEAPVVIGWDHDTYGGGAHKYWRCSGHKGKQPAAGMTRISSELNSAPSGAHKRTNQPKSGCSPA